MTAPKIDTQAPDMIHAAGERLLVEIDMLRDIAGTPDASSICDEFHQWVRARIDDRLASAAREAAAWIEGRNAAIGAYTENWETGSGHALHGQEAAEAITPPIDPAAALDRLIAERVREAVEAERGQIAAALDHEADVCPCEEDAVVLRSAATLVLANFSYDEAEAIVARGSKEGRDV